MWNATISTDVLFPNCFLMPPLFHLKETEFIKDANKKISWNVNIYIVQCCMMNDLGRGLTIVSFY